MKFRKDNSTESGADTPLTSSQEMRDLAEALGLYRSAMKHVAEKQAEQPFRGKPVPVRPAWTRRVRMRLLLVPALAAAMAAAILAPAVSHLHKTGVKTPMVAQGTPQDPSVIVASVDDTELMNKIDSDLTEDVPDALQPLADMDDQTTAKSTGTKATTSSVTEKH
jgi:hypothetical protein